MLPSVFRLHFACLVALLALLGWAQPVHAGAGSAAEAAVQAHEWEPNSVAHFGLSSSEALVREALAPRGAALVPGAAAPEGCLLTEPAWRRAAALAALAMPRARAGARPNCVRIRLLRAALSPNAP